MALKTDFIIKKERKKQRKLDKTYIFFSFFKKRTGRKRTKLFKSRKETTTNLEKPYKQQLFVSKKTY